MVDAKDLNIYVALFQDELSNFSGSNITGDFLGQRGPSKILLTLVSSLKIYVVPLVAAIGLCGNVVSFVVFAGTYLRHLSSSVYLAALSLADAAFLLCVLVSWAEHTGVDIYLQDGWCQTFMYLTHVSTFLSVWYVVAFTVERYIAVHFPLRRQDLCTSGRAKLVVASLAGCAAILYSFGTWTSGVQYLPYPVCAPLPRYVGAVQIVNNVDTVITLLLPFCAILIMNARIAYKVAQFYRDRKHVALRECYTSQSSSTTQRSVPVTRGRQRKVAYTRTQVRVTKMLLSVSTIFLVLNLPRHIARTYSFIMSLLNDGHTNTTTYLAWEQIFRVLYYLHFSVNVFLYSAFGKNFRRAFFWLTQRVRHVVVEHVAKCSTQSRHRSRDTYNALPMRFTEHRSKVNRDACQGSLHEVINDQPKRYD